MKLKFFVYGKLKSDQAKSWMIPFSKSRKYTLHNFKMFMRKQGTAGIKHGSSNNSVIGEIREISWTIWPLNKLLLWFLDLNEGTQLKVYKRILLPQHEGIWTYLFIQSTNECELIKEWDGKRPNYEKCPLCKSNSFKIIYYGFPVRFCKNTMCNCMFGFWCCVTDQFPFDGELFVYDGSYLVGLWNWFLNN